MHSLSFPALAHCSTGYVIMKMVALPDESERVSRERERGGGGGGGERECV